MVVVPLVPLLELGWFGHGTVLGVGVFAVAVVATALAGACEALVEAPAIAAPPRPSPNDPPTIAAMTIGFFNIMSTFPSLFASRSRGNPAPARTNCRVSLHRATLWPLLPPAESQLSVCSPAPVR